MATKLFADFPRIAYTLDDFGSEQVVVDIFRRVIFSKEFLENTFYYEEYEVIGGESPEDLSYRFYGTPNLYWLILMVNGIIDPRFNWPLSEEELYKITKSKYGGENNVFSTNKARNSAGFEVETFFILLEESTHKEPLRLLYEDESNTGISTPIAYDESAQGTDFISNFEIEQEKNEANRTLKILKADVVEEILNNFKTLVNQ